MVYFGVVVVVGGGQFQVVGVEWYCVVGDEVDIVGVCIQVVGEVGECGYLWQVQGVQQCVGCGIGGDV